MFTRRSMRFLWLAISGLLTGLTLVLPQVGFLEWLTLIPAALFLLELGSDPQVRLRRLYGFGLFFFFCFYVVTYHWFVNLYPMDFIDGMTKTGALSVVLLGWFGLSLFQAVQGAFVFVLAAMLFRSSLPSRFSLLKPFVLGGLWAIYEWWQTVGWFGVPWGRLPLGQAYYTVGLQTASLFGPYFITFLLVAVNTLLALVIQKREFLRVGTVSAAILLLFQYGAGTALYLTCRDEGEPISVAAVQGNISSNEKWDSSSNARTLEVYARLTRQVAQNGAELVVFPETAFPYTILEDGFYWRYLSSLAKETGVTILVGCFTEPETIEVAEDTEELVLYNSLLCFQADGTVADAIYSKRHLVPFGEYVPMKSLFEAVAPALTDLVLSSGEIIPGEGGQIVELENVKIGSLICFDSIYEELTRESVREGAELICLSTNDSWFTDSVALSMHNAQAQLRAVETGRYVVRAANTGISTVISPRGDVLCSLEPLVDGVVEAQVYARDGMTLYSHIGNAVVWLSMLGNALILVWGLVVRVRGAVPKRDNCDPSEVPLEK